MDLLESVLRNCHAEQYMNNFRENGVDAFTLKVLNNNDLQVLGIEEKEIRNGLLEHINRLQIPSEKKVQREVNSQYLLVVLNQLSVQLNKHFANLSCALKRSDIVLCDIKSSPASECLHLCIVSLQKELDEFEKQFINKKKKKNRNNIMVHTITAVAFVLIGFCVKKICFVTFLNVR